jgi:hypothetical protein
VRRRGVSAAPIAVGAGEFTFEFAYPAPDPAPVTTIAWRLAHLIVGLATRNGSHFGGPDIGNAESECWRNFTYAGTAKQALEQLDEEYARWIEGLPETGRPRSNAGLRLSGGMLGAEPEQLDRVVDRGEAGLRRHLRRPLLDDPALDLHAAAADPAGQVVVVRGGAALPVQGLARRIPDRIDGALLAEHLQVPVDRGEPDGLAATAQLRVDLLGAAEAGEAGQRGGEG